MPSSVDEERADKKSNATRGKGRALIAMALVLLMYRSDAAAESRPQDLLEALEEKPVHIAGSFEHRWKVDYRAESKRFLELKVRNLGYQTVRVQGVVSWSAQREGPRKETEIPGELSGPLKEAVTQPRQDSWQFSFPVLPRQSATRHLDLGHLGAGYFDAYRGEIRELRLALRGLTEPVEIERLELHPWSWGEWMRSFGGTAKYEGSVRGNLVLLPLICLVFVLLAAVGSRKATGVKAIMAVWIVACLTIPADLGTEFRRAIPKLQDWGEDEELTVGEQRLATLQLALESVAADLPLGADVGLFAAQGDGNALAFRAGYELPLRNFKAARTDRQYQFHLSAETLPRWSETGGQHRWVTLEAGRPLAQSIVPTESMEVVGLEVTTAGQVRLDPGVVQAEIWSGLEKRELLGESTAEAGGRSFTFNPAVRLCAGQNYLIQLRLRSRLDPLRLLVAVDDALPGGRLHGAAARPRMDLRFVMTVAPRGYQHVKTADGGARLFKRGERPWSCD